MLIHKINATTSTNSYLKALLKEKELEQDLVVIADEQLQGRGQMGARWCSQKGKSLTFSVYKRFYGFNVCHHFLLSMAVSLAIKEVLEDFEMPDVKIKWPNDILSANKKICGILIENTLMGGLIKGSVIGVGLNVNEDQLEGLPNASSMRIITNRNFDLDVVFEKLTYSIFQKLSFLQNDKHASIENSYLKSLYRIRQESVFENAERGVFKATIQGVTPEGKLLVETKNRELISFDLKEVKLIFGLQ